MTRTGGRGSVRLALAALLVAVLTAGCGEDRPAPDAAAAALAEGVSALDLSGVPLDGATAVEAGEQLAAAVEGMGGLRPAVTVADVEVADEGETATAELSVVWDVDEGEEDWAYTTTADLTYRDDAWVAAWSPAVLEPSLTAGERLVADELPARRGDVLGADGAVLVTDRPVVRVGIDKTAVPAAQAAASARALAELAGIDPARFAERVADAGPRAFVEAITLRAEDGSPLAGEEVAAIRGAREIPDELPLAPTREFARPVLGTVGEATAELVAESAGRLEAGDVTGLSGLQREYDERLRGRPGLVVRAEPVADGGAPARELLRREPEPGQPLATTLDPALQTAAEDALADVGPPSAVVAVRPSTGEVLAAASGPGGEGYSTATLGRYAPGSTFKVVTSLGLLRAGLTPGSEVPCTPQVTVDGRPFGNYSDYPAGALGDIPLTDAVAYSCNTAFIAQRGQVPQPGLAEAAAALGLGVEADLGLPYFPGSVPTEAGETEHAASMIGQGRVEASPLGMAVVAASVARGGTVTPRLLAEAPAAPATTPAAPVSPAEADSLRRLMRAVVTEGSADFLADVPGPAVLAKTGTAEYGTERPPRTHAWMIAVQDDLAVAVFVEDGESGSRTAGPVLEDFLRSVQ